MAKQSGLGDKLYVGGYDLSGDIGSLQRIGGGPKALEFTGIDKSAFERLGGQLDGSIDFTSFFNDAAGQAFPILKTLPDTDTIVTYLRGTGLGSPAASITAKRVSYDGERDDEGNLKLKTSAVSNGYGLDWGLQLTNGKRTDTTATNGSTVDSIGGTSYSYGLQAYLHVFAFTGTSATIKIQESSDGGGSDAYTDVTGGAFTTVTGITSERIQTSRTQTVEQFLRVVTTGTFSNLVFAVTVNKNFTLTNL